VPTRAHDLVTTHGVAQRLKQNCLPETVYVRRHQGSVQDQYRPQFAEVTPMNAILLAIAIA
jgi:hypothetical protein